MSCGRIALERAGINVDGYYASEIDKNAIKVSAANYPNIKRLGDVQHINYQMLPEIDLLIGGSPCQGFSFAGKQLNFSDPRSALFFEFIHALKEVKPKYFLLENVVMKKEYQDAISELLGCEPIKINSALVSAQNRNRLYWTNIPNVAQPEDRGIVMSDILHFGVGIGASIRGRRLNEDGVRRDHDKAIKIKQRIEIRVDGKSNCLTTVQKDNVVVPQSDGWHKWWNKNKEFQLKKKYSALDPEKAICMTARQYSSWNGTFITISDGVYRKLTVTECERLQTVPDGYTQNKGVSNSQCYKMLGNGWTVDVIAHIFGGL